LRIEAYVFQAYQSILNDEFSKAYYSDLFNLRSFIASSAIVYQTPIGPLSINFNYYSVAEKPISFLFSFGYVMFNKRALD
jgi:NTE family protein